jgi:hypothetical protein
MKQAIAGVAPPQSSEVTIMTVWPTLGASNLGRTLGKLYAIKAGPWIFTVGNLIALCSIPIALPLFFWMLSPWATQRYRLTNRRLVVQRGLKAIDERWVELDRFDSIEVVVLPGQEWYHAGDLVFRNGPVETMRLPGVSRPETFRQTCLKARHSFVGVKKILQHQA